MTPVPGPDFRGDASQLPVHLEESLRHVGQPFEPHHGTDDGAQVWERGFHGGIVDGLHGFRLAGRAPVFLEPGDDGESRVGLDWDQFLSRGPLEKVLRPAGQGVDIVPAGVAGHHSRLERLQALGAKVGRGCLTAQLPQVADQHLVEPHLVRDVAILHVVLLGMAQERGAEFGDGDFTGTHRTDRTPRCQPLSDPQVILAATGL